tara:strand:+ start:4696 stop:5847 length:1152 start_codon:yes stop_codon:yes gene_type:complete
MAENEQTQEKNQEPTQRRLEKAREDGNVLSSKEMFVFGSSAISLLTLAILGFFSDIFTEYWAAFFIFSHPEELLNSHANNAFYAFKIILGGAAIFGIPAFIGICTIQLIVGRGISMSSKALSFKWDKLDPIKGLGRIFSVKGLVELVKSIFKVVFLTSLVVGFMWYSLPNIIYLSAGMLNHSLEILYKLLLMFILVIVLVLFAIGVGDYIWSRHTWLEKLRMSRQDLKEESKESEGSPEVKARIRRLQIEASSRAAQQSLAIEDVKNASVVITNPTHFAVAIKYDPIENEAPLILAMGKDLMAKRVIEQAELNSIALVRSPLLARALYYTGGIGQNISEQLYSAVASILAYVYQIDKGVNVEFNEPEIPADFVFDEFGKRLEE